MTYVNKKITITGPTHTYAAPVTHQSCQNCKFDVNGKLSHLMFDSCTGGSISIGAVTTIRGGILLYKCHNMTIHINLSAGSSLTCRVVYCSNIKFVFAVPQRLQNTAVVIMAYANMNIYAAIGQQMYTFDTHIFNAWRRYQMNNARVNSSMIMSDKLITV